MGSTNRSGTGWSLRDWERLEGQGRGQRAGFAGERRRRGRLVGCAGNQAVVDNQPVFLSFYRCFPALGMSSCDEWSLSYNFFRCRTFVLYARFIRTRTT
eukprot:scaffold3410_cov141-Cylindrotheca_fusiformis.AAC.3